jgi:hypothetical protein
MTIPALQQPIALTHRPATARNAQFRAAPPGIAGERSAVPDRLLVWWLLLGAS